MMKRVLYYLLPAGLLAGAVLLCGFAPDLLSKGIVALMALILAATLFWGFLPMIRMILGFSKGIQGIQEAQKQQASMPWSAIIQQRNFFGMKWMDQRLAQYKQKVEAERKSGMIASDIDDVFNEEEIALKCWHGVMLQIPGTLTGLGLLGTFVGLITGVSGVQLSSVDATLESIQNLLTGIQMAFYTSISGVILSTSCNILYKLDWNILLTQMGQFVSLFHRNVIPTPEEQERYASRKEMGEILKRLKSLPSSDAFSLSNHAAQNKGSSESQLMPQILEGMKKNEFTFYLQPCYDLNTHKVIAAEALARWTHKEMGLVSPGVFIPVMEKNGYITKLDQYIWNKIFVLIRTWIDMGITPVPITINISKTDVLALDIPGVMQELMQKYRIPPKYILLNIAQNAYIESQDIVLDLEETLQNMGFCIVVDGFNGDFFSMRSGTRSSKADAYKLDLRFVDDIEQVNPVIQKARELSIPLQAEGIENMKMLSALRKAGISQGQGFYLSNALPIDAFETMMNWSHSHEEAPA